MLELYKKWRVFFCVDQILDLIFYYAKLTCQTRSCSNRLYEMYRAHTRHRPLFKDFFWYWCVVLGFCIFELFSKLLQAFWAKFLLLGGNTGNFIRLELFC